MEKMLLSVSKIKKKKKKILFEDNYRTVADLYKEFRFFDFTNSRLLFGWKRFSFLLFFLLSYYQLTSGR